MYIEVLFLYWIDPKDILHFKKLFNIRFVPSFILKSLAESVTFEYTRHQNSQAYKGCGDSVDNDSFIGQFSVEIGDCFVDSRVITVVVVLVRFFD